MPYVVSTMKKINFSPATVAEEVVQNVRTILATQVGTVPLFRDFGVSWEGIDKPLPVARAIVRAAVIDAVQRFEPRAVVDSVEWDPNTEDAMQGLLHPVVTVSLADGVEDVAVASDVGVTVPSVFRQADMASSLATMAIELETDIATRIVELEITDYVRVFDLRFTGTNEGGRKVELSYGADVSGASMLETIAAMIDAANSIAAQVSVDVAYYTKILHEFGRVIFTDIYKAGSVIHEAFDVRPADPEPFTSAAGIADLGTLNDLAIVAYANIVRARNLLLDLERDLSEFEHTDFTSIYSKG